MTFPFYLFIMNKDQCVQRKDTNPTWKPNFPVRKNHLLQWQSIYMHNKPQSNRLEIEVEW